MSIDHIGTLGTSVVSGGLVGFLIGYAVKKVLKVAFIIAGLFLGVLAYLQYYELLTVNWDKVESISNHTATTVGNTISQYAASHMITTNLGFPLIGSMATGFVIGFMKG